MGSMNRDILKERILAYPRWYHSFQLDPETKITGWAEATKAYPGSAFAEDSFQYYHLPFSFDGQSVLDIGGWDGAISFEAERRGASRIVLVNPRRLEDIDLPLTGEGSLTDLETRFEENNYPKDFIHSGAAALLV